MSYQYHIRTPYQWGLRRYQTEDGDPSTLTEAEDSLLIPKLYAIKFYGIPFQLFITLCPGGDSVRIPQLKNIVKRFVRATEEHYRAPLGYLVGYEYTPSVNCHLCVTCNAQLNVHRIEDCLKEILGPYLYTDKAVNVQRFDFQKDCVVYALKCASKKNRNRDAEDYDFNNLDLFIPTAEAGLPIFHKRRARAYVRQWERLSHQEQNQVDALRTTKLPVWEPKQLTFKKDFQQAERDELFGPRKE